MRPAARPRIGHAAWQVRRVAARFATGLAAPRAADAPPACMPMLGGFWRRAGFLGRPQWIVLSIYGYERCVDTSASREHRNAVRSLQFGAGSITIDLRDFPACPVLPIGCLPTAGSLERTSRRTAGDLSRAFHTRSRRASVSERRSSSSRTSPHNFVDIPRCSQRVIAPFRR